MFCYTFLNPGAMKRARVMTVPEVYKERVQLCLTAVVHIVFK
jgi:hypothetical protein